MGWSGVGGGIAFLNIAMKGKTNFEQPSFMAKKNFFDNTDFL